MRNLALLLLWLGSPAAAQDGPTPIEPAPVGHAGHAEMAAPRVPQLTLIARNVLAGRAAMLEKRYAEAAITFSKAAEVQEGDSVSVFTDPPDWYYPVRCNLAAALLVSGDRD